LIPGTIIPHIIFVKFYQLLLGNYQKIKYFFCHSGKLVDIARESGSKNKSEKNIDLIRCSETDDSS